MSSAPGVFAVQVRSDAIDYRCATEWDVDLDDITLPADTASVRGTGRLLRLQFCGIDLRRRPDGEHVCFEAWNPMPGYSYFESETGQAISARHWSTTR